MADYILSNESNGDQVTDKDESEDINDPDVVIVANKSVTYKQLTLNNLEAQESFGKGRVNTKANTDKLNQYFTDAFFNEETKKFSVKCKVKTNDQCCGKILVRNRDTRSNLAKHLQIVHNIVVAVEKCPDKNQPTLERCVGGNNMRFAASDPRQVDFDKHLIDMIATSGVPLDVVNNPGFVNLIKQLEPKITIKSRRQIHRLMDDMAQNTIKKSIASTLKSVPKRMLHFTCDIWSTRRREAVLGVLAHFINENWEVKKVLVGFKHMVNGQTSEDVEKAFSEVIGEYGITRNEIGYVVTDNCSTMIKAFKEMSIAPLGFLEDTDEDFSGDEANEYDDTFASILEDSEDEGSQSSFLSTSTYNQNCIFDHIGCLAHMIQLVVNDALKANQDAVKFINYVKSIMGFFKRSTKYSTKLRELTSLDVIPPSTTRWSISCMMLERFAEATFFKAVQEVLQMALQEKTRPGSTPSIPTADDLRMANELISILRPLAKATDLIQGDYVTSSLVVSCLVSSFISIKQVKTTTWNKMKTSLLTSMKSRVESYLQKNEYILATVLDPRIKLAAFTLCWDHQGDGDKLIAPAKDQVMETLKFEIEVNELRERMQQETEDEEIPAKRAKAHDSVENLLDMLDRVEEAKVEKSELDVYLDEARVEKSSNPLTFWSKNSARFPKLAIIARKYLAIPASSGGVERLFSMAGSIGRAKRARVKPKSVENLLLISETRKPIIVKSLIRSGHLKKT